MNRRGLLTVGLPLWVIALLFWVHYVNTYASTSAVSDRGAQQWPTESQLTLHRQLPTLVMFLHPNCFCSRASLWELEELLARFPQRVSASLVMVSDSRHAEAWRDTTLQKQARDFQEVTVVQDGESREASLFHARTSGEAFVYSSTGQLLFQGGITAARGHMGDAPGQEAIAKILEQHRDSNPDDLTRCNVYGCQLTQYMESRP